jgi:predicted nucleic acid-binding protein
VPSIWRHEFLNILVTSCLFAKLPRDAAVRLWRDAEEMLRGSVHETSMSDVLSVAVERSITAYDAEYVLLAQAEGVKCVTEDVPLQKVFPAVAVSMAVFLGIQEPSHAVRETAGPYSTRRKR